MNIPLNIDWQQILLHLFNFGILAAGLNWLLYKPVKTFMEKRKTHYSTLEEQTKENLAQAQALETEYSERLRTVEVELAEKRTEAQKEAEKIVKVQLNEAQIQAKEILTSAQVDAQIEHQKIVDSAQEEIARLAVEATEKLMKQREVNAYDQFLSAVEGGVVGYGKPIEES